MNNIMNSVINFLRSLNLAGYSSVVAAKSAAGRRNPCNLKATQHAPCVYFYVAALAHLYLSLALHHQNYGSPGGAAYGLAGILQSRYSYPRPGYHPRA